MFPGEFQDERKAVMNIRIEVLQAVSGLRELLRTDGWQFDATGAANLSGVQNQQDARKRLLRLGLLTSGQPRIDIGEPELLGK